VISYLMLK